MIKATQLPSGKWRARVDLGVDAMGKRKWKSITRQTEQECIAEAIKISTHIKEIESDMANMTVGEAIDTYIAEKGNLLSPSTVRGYEGMRKNQLQPEENVKVKDLTRRRCQVLVNREAATCSPKTVRNVWGLVSAIMTYCEMEVPKITLPPKEQNKGVVLDGNEIARLLEAIRGHAVEVPVLFALWLGLRRSEVFALTWDDYDSVKKLLHINKAMVLDKDNRKRIKGTKTTSSTRTIPVPTYITDILDGMPHDTERIVMMHPNSLIKMFHRVCDEVGLPKVRYHDLRHTNASVMLLLNIADKYAMERGGWSDSGVLKSVYQHTFAKEKEEVNKKVDSYFENVISPNNS